MKLFDIACVGTIVFAARLSTENDAKFVLIFYVAAMIATAIIGA